MKTADYYINKLNLTSHIEGGAFKCVIQSGSWFGSRCEVSGGFSLVGCTVAPGFDFEDFELVTLNVLTSEFPQYIELIKELTRS
ncbi:MAG: cupin domain-containing protein [Bacteroidota bacterium]|nr:cupin domain-containing protein [Bacteroidota bacterium]